MGGPGPAPTGWAFIGSPDCERLGGKRDSRQPRGFRVSELKHFGHAGNRDNLLTKALGGEDSPLGEGITELRDTS